MIKINLMEVRAESRTDALKIQAAVAVVALLVTVGVCFHFYSSINSEIERVQNEVRTTRQAIQDMRAIIGEIDEIKQRKETVERQLEVINQLEAGRLDTVQMMEAVSRATPEQLWLQRLTYAGTGVQINGLALDNHVIAELIQNLNRNPNVSGVVLSETTRVRHGNIDAVRFSMRFNVRPIRDEQKG
jgi:type IV pilus assembly protein PilN